MFSIRLSARLFGIFFILSFISYALGMGLIESLGANPSEALQNISSNSNQLIVGAILTGLFHSLFNVGLLVILFSVLKKEQSVLAYGFLILGIMATLLLAIGAIFLLLLIPLSEAYTTSEAAQQPFFKNLFLLCSKGNFYAYQMGMTLWGIGGLLYCTLLYRSKLIPHFIPIWGVWGYLIFITGTLLELFGISAGVALSIPGGLFELFLSFWLIFKGFKSVESTTLSPYFAKQGAF